MESKRWNWTKAILQLAVLIATLFILTWLVTVPYVYPQAALDMKSVQNLRPMSIIGETVLVPYEVPNFSFSVKPRGQMDTYVSRILTVTLTTYDDPHKRDLIYYVISIAMHQQNNRTIVFAIMVITEGGVSIASYIDEDLLKMGSPSGNLLKSIKQPNLKRVIKLLERQKEA
jgi:hypothetical protein